MATITDKRVQVDNGSGGLAGYKADVASAQEYYAFSSQMPGRTGVGNFNAGAFTWSINPSNYRYGFNGKENDNDVGKGMGNQQDYGMRIYDPRVGKFLSVDPMTACFAWNSPYPYAENDPISSIDLDGMEKVR